MNNDPLKTASLLIGSSLAAKAEISKLFRLMGDGLALTCVYELLVAASKGEKDPSSDTIKSAVESLLPIAQGLIVHLIKIINDDLVDDSLRSQALIILKELGTTQKDIQSASWFIQ